MFKRELHIYPVGNRWSIAEMTKIEAFFFDARRFGLKMALRNLFWRSPN